jgi:glycerophosphoryl diester phosphodiesterase
VSAAVEPLVDALRRTGTVERVCVGSFADTRLRRIRAAAGPALATSLGPREVLSLRAESLRASRGRRVPDVPCVQVPPRLGPVAIVDERFVAAAHRRGLQVHTWTINDRAEMIRLLDLGVDGIMTDRADLLRDVLLDRGQWSGGQVPDH